MAFWEVHTPLLEITIFININKCTGLLRKLMTLNIKNYCSAVCTSGEGLTSAIYQSPGG